MKHEIGRGKGLVRSGLTRGSILGKLQPMPSPNSWHGLSCRSGWPSMFFCPSIPFLWLGLLLSPSQWNAGACEHVLLFHSALSSLHSTHHCSVILFFHCRLSITNVLLVQSWHSLHRICNQHLSSFLSRSSLPFISMKSMLLKVKEKIPMEKNVVYEVSSRSTVGECPCGQSFLFT